ncbi:MAG: hypothetical protein JWR60_1223 [Polaromonas sp.]|nr:hypothetical protein [Polaromonas sp.]
MQRQNLIVARVGQNSLHSTWLAPAENRNWDLYLCPYQQLPAASAPDCTLGKVIAGPKWTGLRELLNEWPGWQDYERIWLPDDDILASPDTINRMFSLAEALEFDLCAPALHEASYYAHYSTMRNRRCFARRTGFVEIMVPCFSTRALKQLLPTLDLSPTGWGWGLDSLWPKLLGYRNIGIIDAATVVHTRPVGLFRDAGLGQRVRAESDRIMEKYNCRQVHQTFAAIQQDLQDMALAPDALTSLLADGWRYLSRSNPAVLPLLVNAQQPEGGWGDYPIAGTPSCAA